MAGNITLKQGTSITTVSSGSAVSTGTLVAANGASNLINSSGLYQMVSARLTGAFASAPTEANTISLYLYPKLDGTNIASVDTNTPYGNQNYLVGNFIITPSTTSTLYLDIDQIPLAAYDYAPYIYNGSGQQLSAGWSLIFYPTLYQYT